MLFRLLTMWVVVAKTFGKVFAPLATIAWLLLLRVLNAAGLFLDPLFFPALRDQRVENPIVIVGLPRSGTTFLHRFLTEQGLGVGLRLWKMIFPSLALQAVLKPFVPLLENLSPARHHATAAHRTSLMSVETDDPALLFRYFDGFFAYGFFLAWAERDLRGQFDPGQRDTSTRDFRYLNEIWKRNLVGEHGVREVGKMFSLLPRVPQFLSAFPDARIIFMVRDPVATIPSAMSLLTGVLDRRFGFWGLDEVRRGRYLTRLYQGLLDMSLRFYADYIAGRIPRNRILIVSYPRLMREFAEVMEEIAEFADITLSDSLRENIRATAAKQRSYTSGHRYSLVKFGLTEARIRRDFAPIYKTFLVPSPSCFEHS